MRNEASAVCPWCGMLSSHQTRVCCEAKMPRNATPYVGFLFRCYSDPFLKGAGEAPENLLFDRMDEVFVISGR